MISKPVFKTDTGTAAVSFSVPADSFGMSVKMVYIKFDVLPTTSENLTVNLNSAAGAAYDTLLLDVDLSTYDAAADGSLSLIWDGPGADNLDNKDIILYPGDSLDFAYTNTDGNTASISVYGKEGV